jgi:hypothetical protein
VQRILSICLLVLFSFLPISPLLASKANSEAGLPVCCRRNGAHHCLMSVELAKTASKNDAFSAAPLRCAEFPKAVASVQRVDQLHLSSALHLAELVTLPAITRQAEVRTRVALDRTRHKRGPPAFQI